MDRVQNWKCWGREELSVVSFVSVEFERTEWDSQAGPGA